MNFGRNRRRGTAICATVLLIMVVWLVPACFAVDASEAGKAIGQANQDLNAAYIKVAEADSAGADVSVLMNELNSAGTYLSSANVAFKAGDYENASVLAANCIDTLNGVASEAANLKSYAQGAHTNMLFEAAFVSVIGVVFIIVLGFMGWRVLRRRYFRGILNKKFRVADLCEL